MPDLLVRLYDLENLDISIPENVSIKRPIGPEKSYC